MTRPPVDISGAHIPPKLILGGFEMLVGPCESPMDAMGNT